jgi:hypothetical protein
VRRLVPLKGRSGYASAANVTPPCEVMSYSSASYLTWLATLHPDAQLLNFDALARSVAKKAYRGGYGV